MLVSPGSLVSDNHLQLLHNGSEYFPELIRHINQAHTEIYFETYIFHPDETGESVVHALNEAARRGVQVHVITDWLGTGAQLCRKLQQDFEKSGVQFRVFNPWFYRGLARQHRKLCVIDHQYAFVGGINIIDDYRYDFRKKDKFLKAPRWDFAVLVEGPILNLIQQEVVDFWERTGYMPIGERLRKYRTSFQQQLTRAKVALAGFVIRDNFRNRRTIQKVYLRAIGQARREVVLATPYFAPTRKFRSALKSAAARGVKVTLLVGVGEFWWHDAVTKSFFPKLLRAGIRLYEYNKTQLHGKVAVVDNIWATVGSSNCDAPSFFVNHEANIIVRDTAFATSLSEHIFAGVADADEILLSFFEEIPWYQRFWYGTAHLIYRSIMRLITWGDYN